MAEANVPQDLGRLYRETLRRRTPSVRLSRLLSWLAAVAG
jgi:hypothetical protein